MADNETKLDRFIQHILDDATIERDNILACIDTRRASEIEAAEDAVLAQTYEYIHKSVADIRAEAGRKVSERMLANKRETATRRGMIAGEVFGKVREHIGEFTASPEYKDHMERLFKLAFEAMGRPGDAVVYLRQEDMHLRQELLVLCPEAALEFRTGDFTMGGIILDCRSKQLRIDESFDTALADLDGHFAELFGLSISE